MKKSVLKRIRITKNGKLVRRPMSVNHFRTRKSTKNLRSKRKTMSLGVTKKAIQNY